MDETHVLRYLYEKLKINPDKQNQICLTQFDYEKISGSIASKEDVLKINEILLSLQNKGYILCPRLKDRHIYAAWIKITEKTLNHFNKGV